MTRCLRAFVDRTNFDLANVDSPDSGRRFEARVKCSEYNAQVFRPLMKILCEVLGGSWLFLGEPDVASTDGNHWLPHNNNGKHGRQEIQEKVVGHRR